MEKICWHTSTYENSDIVILGIPDESRSHSLREGTSYAPDVIRKISNVRDVYQRQKNSSKGYPYNYITNKIHDYGNIQRIDIPRVFDKIIFDKKIVITLGGDHSITSPIIKTITKQIDDLSLIYFDAHPDFITSIPNYYGSVFGDVLSYINTNSSIQVGIRTPEREELENLQKNQITVITPFDFEEKGISKIASELLNTLGENIYISFDMDCIDPAYAPGVSVPVPMGLSSIQATFLLKKIAQKGIVGMDIVEVCPPYDIDNRTSHLASRLVGEIVSSSRYPS